MEIQKMMKFLDDLANHNTFTWMHDHQKEYQEAKQIFLDLMQELVFRLGKEDSRILDIQVKKCMARLVRDTRFSKDKTPYNPTFNMHISPYGNAPIPCGIFIHMEEGNCFVGGGIFLNSFAEATNRIRKAIALNENEFLKIAEDLKAQGIEIMGMKLKRVPKEFDADTKAAEYLKYKSWFVEVPFTIVDDEEQLLEQMMQANTMIAPLNAFLNEALGDLQMPAR